MKRIICLFLTSVLLLISVGCTSNIDVPSAPKETDLFSLFDQFERGTLFHCSEAEWNAWLSSSNEPFLPEYAGNESSEIYDVVERESLYTETINGVMATVYEYSGSDSGKVVSYTLKANWLFDVISWLFLVNVL